MITSKDKIEQFKRDCRSMEYWTKMYLSCNEKLEEIAVHLRGVSSPHTDDVRIENAGDPYKNGKIYWFHEEDKVMQERDEYIKNMERVNSKLMMITNPADQQMIRELYVEKRNHEQVASRFHYANRMTMYKHVNNVLRKIL